MRVKGHIALITGASRGIGLAIATRFRDLGVKVLTPGHREMDLSSDASVDEYVASLEEPIDLLINNAGINLLADVMEISDKDIEKTLQVNLVSPMRLARGIIPSMVERKYGRIVNISSIWGSFSKPKRLAYSASKSGINGMTRALAVELTQYNILVNAVAPGFVNTELTRQNNTEEELKAITSAIPARRLAEPTEIAEVVAFLGSEKNSFISGQVIIVDGGFSCQ